MTRSRIVQSCLCVALALVGCVFQGNCAGALAQVNPCGTIFSTDFCDPVAFSQLFGSPFESDFDVDPTCIVPFSCGAALP